MSKLKILSKALFMLMLANIFAAKAQIPMNDVSWIEQNNTYGSDDFCSLDTTSRWYPRYPFFGATYNFGSAELNYYSNLTVPSCTLKIKADTIQPSSSWVPYSPSDFHSPPGQVHYAYTGGILWHRKVVIGGDTVDPYYFGYVEINAKFPTGYYPLWPAFWLYGGRDCLYDLPHYYNEIDIVENHPDIAFDGYKTSTNTHIDADGCDDIENYQEINTGFLLSSAFHKYACEWAPDRIIYYIDDIPVRTIYDPTGFLIPQERMTAILNFSLAADRALLPTDWNNPDNPDNPNPENYTSWSPSRLVPQAQYLEVDYLKYYTLTWDCSTNLLNLCTPAGYDRKVKGAIATDNTCTPTFNPSTAAGSYTLRATNSVTLDAGTVVNPTGTGYFAVQTLVCPP